MAVIKLEQEGAKATEFKSQPLPSWHYWQPSACQARVDEIILAEHQYLLSVNSKSLILESIQRYSDDLDQIISAAWLISDNKLITGQSSLIGSNFQGHMTLHITHRLNNET
jgi:hypothetical protein